MKHPVQKPGLKSDLDVYLSRFGRSIKLPAILIISNDVGGYPEDGPVKVWAVVQRMTGLLKFSSLD